MSIEFLGDNKEQEEKVAKAFEVFALKQFAIRETRLALLPRAKELSDAVSFHATCSNNKESDENIALALTKIGKILSTFTKEEHDHFCAMAGVQKRYFNFIFKKPLKTLLKNS
jgi:hypothetical protein